MKKYFLILLSILIALISTSSVLAAYYATYTITETNGNAYGMLAVQEDCEVRWLVNNGYITATGLDTRVETLAGSQKPWMVMNDRVFTAVPVPADSQTNLYFTTGNTAAASMDIFAGYGGYITMIDDADLELGDDFEIVIDGYVNTASGDTKYLVNKGYETFRIFISDTGEISSYIDSLQDANYSGSIDANRAFDSTNYEGQSFTTIDAGFITRVDARINGVSAASTVCAIRACAAGVPTGPDLATATFTPAGGGSLVSIYFDNLVYVTAATQYAFIFYKTGAGTEGMQVDNTAPAYAGGTRVWSNDSGATWNSDATEDEYIFNVYITDVEVTATGIATGEHEILVGADGVDFYISIDGAVAPAPAYDEIALAGATVPDNGNTWHLMYNATTDFTQYWDYYTHSVDSGGGLTLIVEYDPVSIVRGEAYAVGTVTVTNGDATVLGAGGAAWTQNMVGSIFVSADGLQYVVATVTDATHIELSAVYAGGTLAGQAYNFYVRLVDEEGADEDGQLTLGANPAGVAVAIGSLTSTAQPAAGDILDDPPLDILPPVELSDWYVDPDVTGALLTNPIRPFVTIMSDASSMTEMQAWRLLGLAFVLFVTVVAAVAVRSHLLIAGVACAVALGLCIAMTIFPPWALIFVIGAIGAGLIAERSPSL